MVFPNYGGGQHGWCGWDRRAVPSWRMRAWRGMGEDTWLERKRGARWMSSEWSNCRVVGNVEVAYTRAQIYYYVSPPIRKRLSLFAYQNPGYALQATLRIYKPCDSLAHYSYIRITCYYHSSRRVEGYYPPSYVIKSTM